MDGRGLVHWICEIFRALRGEELQGSSGTMSELDIVEKFEFSPDAIKPGNCQPLSPLSTEPELRGSHWLRFTWHGKTSKILPKIIIAAGNLSRQSNGPDNKLVFRITSDLRRHLAKDAPFSMANSVGAFNVEVKPSATINSVYKDILGAIRNKHDVIHYPKILKALNWTPHLLGRTPNQDKIKTKRHQKGKYNYTGAISYLGNYETRDIYSCPSFTATGMYGIPMPLEDISVFIGFSTNEVHGLEGTIGVPKALASMEELLALREALTNQLDNL
jgi:hypothetical protein